MLEGDNLIDYALTGVRRSNGLNDVANLFDRGRVRELGTEREDTHPAAGLSIGEVSRAGRRGIAVGSRAGRRGIAVGRSALVLLTRGGTDGQAGKKGKVDKIFVHVRLFLEDCASPRGHFLPLETHEFEEF